MQLSEILIDSCRKILKEQNKDGSFKPGCNGPYGDPETPVRNTAHWLITLLKAYELTDDTIFMYAAIKAADYLLSPVACPMNASFFCRKNPQKDFSNGLIGQAWVIEALIEAADMLKKDVYYEKALSVFEKHYFNETLGLWRILNVDGSYAGFDLTFNHQLWFAMAGAMIVSHGQSNSVEAKVRRFLDKANVSHFCVSKSGRIVHAIRNPSLFMHLARFTMKLLKPGKFLKEKRVMRHKENGYHGFNLYALAVLKPLTVDHILWKSNKLRKAVGYINENYFIESLEKNEFAYPYNPSGFELAFVVENFFNFSEVPAYSTVRWINKQLAHCFDPDHSLMIRNTMDPLTLAARLYEATRLSNIEVGLK
nr:hypothetical protein [uncultured Desulfobacter sp.]